LAARITLPDNSKNRWDCFLLKSRIIDDSAIGIDQMAGKIVLLTGAGGSIGSAVAEKILSGKPRQLLLLDNSEQALFQLGRSLACLEGAPAYRLILGDLRDRCLITALLEEDRPDTVLHAAAYKHVPMMEANPFAAIQNNAILTWQLVEAAAMSGVPEFLFISTDKAANPHSILGVSKRLAEQAVIRWSAPSRRYAAMRLVNVLGSSGSVLPLFLEQIRRGGPLTITHPDAVRYFTTLKDTVALILAASSLPEGGVVYLPKLSASQRVLIVDLARLLLRHMGAAEESKIRTEFTGLRPGEKLVEDLFCEGEVLRSTAHPAISAASGILVSADTLDRAFVQLKETVRRRDLAALLETCCQMIPEYQPSEALWVARQMAHG
jgi:FlaA1/EpsC-like NDP-sugar epimerase